VSFLVRAALPGEYAEAGRVTTEGYHADDLLRRPDGLIDNDYEARLTEADRRAREAELMVAGRWRQGPWHGYVVSAHIAIAGADYTPTERSSGCSRCRQLDGDAASAAGWSRHASAWTRSPPEVVANNMRHPNSPVVGDHFPIGNQPVVASRCCKRS
jgi:hypothetical protein